MKTKFIQIYKKWEYLKKPFLDISDHYPSFHEVQRKEWIVRLAFHPRYIKNGFFYLSYINKQNTLVISRFNVSKDIEIADENSEKIVMKIEK